MPEVKYEIIKTIFNLKGSGTYHKELNLVSWNDRDPVYDLRGWNDDHTKMTKGVTLTVEELEELKIKLMEEPWKK